MKANTMLQPNPSRQDKDCNPRSTGALAIALFLAMVQLLAFPDILHSQAATAPSTFPVPIITRPDALMPVNPQLDVLPPPWPWLNIKASDGKLLEFRWQTGQRLTQAIFVDQGQPVPANVELGDAQADAFASMMTKLLGPQKADLIIAPERITDVRFSAKIHYRLKKNGTVLDTVLIRHRVANWWTNIQAKIEFAENEDGNKLVQAVDALADDVALSLVPHGKKPAQGISFASAPLLPPRKPGDGINIGDKPKLAFTSATDGKPMTLADLHGKVVIVDFWASWGEPSLAIEAKLSALNQTCAAKGVQIIGINLDRDKTAMQTIIKAKSLKWPQCFEEKGLDDATARSWGVTGVPFAFILNPEGQIIWRGQPSGIELVLDAALVAFPPRADESK